MIVQPSPQIVSDYCANHSTIRVNRDYQRSGQIWPKRAKSALIETIVLGYPMPAMYLHQQYDKDARKPYKDLVDGQQRTECLMEFYNDELRLSKTLKTEEIRNKTLQELEPQQYEAFMSYSLPIFLFTQASEWEVREAFRRINSYNAVLNAQEIRHSRFQGEFKWFVHGLTGEIGGELTKLGTVTKADMVRMKDTALVSEVCLLALEGIKTTKQEHITKFYEKYDKSFDEGPLLRKSIVDAVDLLVGWADVISNTPLARPYQVLVLILAIMHARSEFPALSVLGRGGVGLRERSGTVLRLSELANALQARADLEDEEDEEGEAGESGGVSTLDDEVSPSYEELSSFVSASKSKTNTSSHRSIRFRYFLNAVGNDP